MTGPRVSIVVPFHNAQAFLEEAIASVRAQDFTDWELLLADDGSTDDGPAIAIRHVQADPLRVRLLRHPDGANHGVTATRNLALRAARAEWIALLDADDVWVPGKLSRQVGVLDAHPDIGMLYGASEYWHDWAPHAAASNTVPPIAEGSRAYGPLELFRVNFPLGRAGAPCPSNLMFSRAAAIALGGFEESFVGCYEDVAFAYKFYVRHRTWVDGACGARYRIHPGSLTARQRQRGEEEAARDQFFVWLARYLDQHGVTDAAARRALRAATWHLRHPAAYAGYRRLRSAARPLRALWRRAIWRVAGP